MLYYMLGIEWLMVLMPDCVMGGTQFSKPRGQRDVPRAHREPDSESNRSHSSGPACSHPHHPSLPLSRGTGVSQWRFAMLH